jgi:hypothetical protein
MIMRARVLLALDTSVGEVDSKEVIATRLGVSGETLRLVAKRRPYARLWQRACRLEQQGDREHRWLNYARYADDWLLGFTGPKREAEEIKADIGRFLHDELKLELSEEKTYRVGGPVLPAHPPHHRTCGPASGGSSS